MTAAEALTAAAPEADGDAAEHGIHKEPEDHGEASADGGTDRHDGPDHASTTLEYPDPVDVDVLARALSAQADRLVRAKGVVQDAQGRWHEVQLAGGRVDVRPRSDERLPPERPALVLIAAGSDAERQVGEAAAALAPRCAPTGIKTGPAIKQDAAESEPASEPGTTQPCAGRTSTIY